ncbi:MAG: hypothetical protein JWM82_1951, partial [Myxococcales bacterium]|nr:hypothetical protein [Myxococcales bacterium]
AAVATARANAEAYRRALAPGEGP